MMSTIEDLKVEFGCIEDYYPTEEIDAEKRAAWARAKDQWARAIREAEKSVARGDMSAAREALDEAARAEREWGDDPSTRRWRHLHALA